MKKIVFSLSIVVSFLVANEVSKKNIVPMGNVMGSTGVVFPEGKARIFIKNISFMKDKAYNGDEEVQDIQNKEFKMNITQFVARYGFGNNFDVRAIISHKTRTLTQTIPKGDKKGTSFDMKNSGLGDSMIIARYLILKKKGMFFSVGAGLKLPTGDTSKTFNTPMGEKESKDTMIIQNGSGSYDYLFEVGATQILKNNARIDAQFMYRQSTKGANDYQFGNQIKYNIGYSYALTPSFDVQMELNGINCQKHTQNSIKIDYTGGNFLYLTPGIHYKVNKHFDISTAYSYMIKKDVNYDSKTKTGGLSEDNMLVVKVGYNF